MASMRNFGIGGDRAGGRQTHAVRTPRLANRSGWAAAPRPAQHRSSGRSSVAVFLDRDGVIVDLVPDPRSGTNESPYRPIDVELVAGAVEGIRVLKDAGFLLVAASNQPAAAKGTVTMGELEAVHLRVLELLSDEGVKLDGWRYCFHHPRGVGGSLSIECACRKPNPGLLLTAAADLKIDIAGSWMVGDAVTDVEAGHSAGCATVLLEHPGSSHRRPAGASRPGYTAPCLRSAADLISSQAR